MVLGQQFRLGIAGSTGHLALRSPGPCGRPSAGSSHRLVDRHRPGCRSRPGMLGNRPAGRAAGNASGGTGLRPPGATTPRCAHPTGRNLALPDDRRRIALWIDVEFQRSTKLQFRSGSPLLPSGAGRCPGAGPDRAGKCRSLAGRGTGPGALCTDARRVSELAPTQPVSTHGPGRPGCRPGWVWDDLRRSQRLRDSLADGGPALSPVPSVRLRTDHGFSRTAVAGTVRCAATISPCGCDGIRRSASANQPTVAECPIAGLQISRPGRDASCSGSTGPGLPRSWDPEGPGFACARPGPAPLVSPRLQRLDDAGRLGQDPQPLSRSGAFRTDDCAVCVRARSTMRRHGCLRVPATERSSTGGRYHGRLPAGRRMGILSPRAGKMASRAGPGLPGIPVGRSRESPCTRSCPLAMRSRFRVGGKDRGVVDRPQGLLVGGPQRALASRSRRRSRERGVPLGRLPHWSPAHFTHIRVLVRSDHPITLETPRLLR